MYPVEIKSLCIFQTTSSALIIYDIFFFLLALSLFLLNFIKQLDKANQNTFLILRHHQPQVRYKQKV